MTSPQNPFATPEQPGPEQTYGAAQSYGQQSYGQQSYGPPPGYGAPVHGPGQWSGAPQTETKAMIALGLAIAAYTPTIPFIGAIAAIVLARMARRDILASGGRLTGLSLCTWATALAWVHLVLITLLFVVILAVFLLPFSVAFL